MLCPSHEGAHGACSSDPGSGACWFGLEVLKLSAPTADFSNSSKGEARSCVSPARDGPTPHHVPGGLEARPSPVGKRRPQPTTLPWQLPGNPQLRQGSPEKPVLFTSWARVLFWVLRRQHADGGASLGLQEPPPGHTQNASPGAQAWGRCHARILPKAESQPRTVETERNVYSISNPVSQPEGKGISSLGFLVHSNSAGALPSPCC